MQVVSVMDKKRLNIAAYILLTNKLRNAQSNID